MRPITAGKCVCDGYIAPTKVHPVTRTRDTGRAQDTDNRAWWWEGEGRQSPSSSPSSAGSAQT